MCLAASVAQAQVGPIQSNSLVRFRVSYGLVPVGDIDVELFDVDKPVTVSNFLFYAQSGAYSNGILHRLIPNFIVQGGLGGVANPFANSSFSTMLAVATGAAITNEFFVGPRYTNTFGTLAMARDSSFNSAKASWFFNLTNNAATLDPQRYTVFGRITTGSNILDWFNTFSEGNGIVNMTNSTFLSAGCVVPLFTPLGVQFSLTALPVAPTSGTCPRYVDLLHVEVIMLGARDVLPPTLTVSAPKANLKLTNANVLVNGTSSDNAAVAQVLVGLNGDAPVVAATNGSAWSFTLTNVPPGTNIILVTALDTSSNQTQVTRSFFRSAPVPLGLQIVGLGTVTGATNGQLLDVGRGYTLVAKPARGQLFVDWSGSTSSISATLKFLMESNLNFIATFATNLFPYVKGTYNGLFYDSNDVQQISSGYLTLKIGDAGSYSGKLLLSSKSYSLKGTLGAYGFGSNTVLRPATNPLVLMLTLDLTNGTEQLTGTVSEAMSGTNVWTAQLVADRAVFNAKTNLAPQAGKYTMIVPIDTNSPSGPTGDGFGAVTVSTAGAVSFSGTLADGTKVTQKTGLSKDGHWPLFAALYKGKGSLLSWVTFTNETDSDFNGLFNWFKQTQTAKYYPGGFTNEAVLVGSHFLPPTPTNLVLHITNGVVAFTNGNLIAGFTNLVVLDAKGKVMNEGTNKLSLSISKSSGTFSGSVTPPGGGKAVSFKGALLQKQNLGSGFFLGTNSESGRVLIREP
jgi:cyclophilin family peptidyl-prolyl cis-trans isomerase